MNKDFPLGSIFIAINDVPAYNSDVCKLVHVRAGDIMIFLGTGGSFLKSHMPYGFLHPTLGYIETLRHIATEHCSVIE